MKNLVFLCMLGALQGIFLREGGGGGERERKKNQREKKRVDPGVVWAF